LREQEITYERFTSDALVFFAPRAIWHTKDFPALQAMIKRGHLDVPVIGVAKAGWNWTSFGACAREPRKHDGGSMPRRSRS